MINGLIENWNLRMTKYNSQEFSPILFIYCEHRTFSQSIHYHSQTGVKMSPKYFQKKFFFWWIEQKFLVLIFVTNKHPWWFFKHFGCWFSLQLPQAFTIFLVCVHCKLNVCKQTLMEKITEIYWSWFYNLDILPTLG